MRGNATERALAQGVRFRHLRLPASHVAPGDRLVGAAVTLAIWELRQASSLAQRRFEVGAAYCNPRDRFDRAVGREISAGRLVKRPIVFWVPEKREDEHPSEFWHRVDLSAVAALEGNRVDATSDSGRPSWAWTVAQAALSVVQTRRLPVPFVTAERG